MILDPEALARAFDPCPACGHERRWHEPCTARIPSDDPPEALCLCPHFAAAPVGPVNGSGRPETPEVANG